MNKKAVGYIAAGIAGPTLLHLGFDTKLFDDQSIFQMTDSAARFLNYGLTALAFGKAGTTQFEEANGRKPTSLEKIGIYSLGAMAATGLWEGWENVGQLGAIYNGLHQAFGEYAKTGFPGIGMESFRDAAYTVAGTTAAVAGAEALSALRKSRKE